MAGEKGKRPNPFNYSNDSVLLQRRLSVLRMRTEGRSYRSIGAELGISYNTVRNDEKAMLDEYQMPAVDEYRRKVIVEAEAQLERLHAQLARTQYVITNKGEVAYGPDGEAIVDTEKAVKIELAIMKLRDQLIRMLGVNAPQQTEVTVEHVDQTDLAIATLLDEMRAKNESTRQALEADN